MTALRQYEPWELGPDGYPYAWHGEDCLCDYMELAGPDRCPDEDGSCRLAIKDMIREEAQNRCERCWHPYAKGSGEWSPCDEKCKHAGEQRWRLGDGAWHYSKTGTPSREIAWAAELQVEARYRILTVHHLDGDKANCRWWNLVALCQRCHLLIQRKVQMGRPYHLDHSKWFEPYAAAFYAFKYLGEDLSREEVMARLPSLLRLEYQGTQERLV